MRNPLIPFLFVVGCGPSVPVESGGATSGTSDGDGSGSSGPTIESTTSTTSTTTTTDTTSAGESSSDGGDISTSSAEDHGGFIHPADGGTMSECDIWIDDCPPGEKCMPWANDGGNSWNATKCSPLADDPNHVGDPCTVEGSGVSGLDDCEARSMCWDVDWETNTGTCVAFCNGSEANPTCAGGACTDCTIANDGVLILCLAACDPLSQDCQEGDACWPTFEGSFTCMPDPVGPELGALGDACEFVNVCDPGLFCAPADRLPSCAAQGCCSKFCDVSAADPCPDSIAGTECVPWFDEGEAPPCFAHVVGGCLLPE